MSYKKHPILFLTGVSRNVDTNHLLDLIVTHISPDYQNTLHKIEGSIAPKLWVEFPNGEVNIQFKDKMSSVKGKVLFDQLILDGQTISAEFVKEAKKRVAVEKRGEEVDRGGRPPPPMDLKRKRSPIRRREYSPGDRKRPFRERSRTPPGGGHSHRYRSRSRSPRKDDSKKHRRRHYSRSPSPIRRRRSPIRKHHHSRRKSKSWSSSAERSPSSTPPPPRRKSPPRQKRSPSPKRRRYEGPNHSAPPKQTPLRPVSHYDRRVKAASKSPPKISPSPQRSPSWDSSLSS